MNRVFPEQAIVGKATRAVTVDQEGLPAQETFVDVDDGNVPPGGHSVDGGVHFLHPVDGQGGKGKGIDRSRIRGEDFPFLLSIDN